MLAVQGLRKVYESKGRSVEALRDLTFTLDAGELVCLVGPSGCGKTTLLKCIAGLIRPTAGTIRLQDSDVVGPTEGMAVVLQEYGRSLFPWMTVEDNVKLPLRHKRLSRDRRTELVHNALEAVGLLDARKAHPWELSGGMQQRVAIARAVAYEPTVLLMDEPFAAVDAQTRADLEDLIRSIWTRTQVTTLFITHDIDEAVYLGQRIIVLSMSPTVIMEDLKIGLPQERDQIATRATREFTDLRTHVYEQVRAAKQDAGKSQ
jgi:NitT/TauT family transport system ATP-binding protein